MIFAGLSVKYSGEQFNDEQKFVIVRHPSSERLHLFNFYAVDLWSNQRPTCEEIVKGFELQQDLVLGGGRVSRSGDHSMGLHAESIQYGGVPRRFLEFFKNSILTGYQQKFPELESIIIAVPEKTTNDDKVSFLNEFGK